jgi:hypothetical protein
VSEPISLVSLVSMKFVGLMTNRVATGVLCYYIEVRIMFCSVVNANFFNSSTSSSLA